MHYFRVRDTNFVEIFLHQFKRKQVSPLLCDGGGGVVDAEMFSETHEIMLIY